MSGEGFRCSAVLLSSARPMTFKMTYFPSIPALCGLMCSVSRSVVACVQTRVAFGGLGMVSPCVHAREQWLQRRHSTRPLPAEETQHSSPSLCFHRCDIPGPVPSSPSCPPPLTTSFISSAPPNREVKRYSCNAVISALPVSSPTRAPPQGSNALPDPRPPALSCSPR